MLKITPVKMGREQLEQVFPKDICDLVETAENIVFGAMEDKKLRAAAVLAASDSREEGYILSYITLMDEEDYEAFDALMDFIENECREKEGKLLCCRMFLDEDSPSIRPLLYERDYDDLSENGVYLCYSVSDILKTLFGSKREALKELITHVKCYNELTKEEIAVFIDKMKSARHEVKMDMPDLVFGRFYILNGEVVGYMDIREIKPGIIYLNDTYIKESKSTKYALPAMIASAMTAFEALLPEESYFGMQIFNTNLLNGIRAIYGEALVEMEILEMCKVL